MILIGSLLYSMVYSQNTPTATNGPEAEGQQLFSANACYQTISDAYKKEEYYIHPKTLSRMTAALLSNFTLGYNGFGANTSNGSINVGGDKTQASITVGLFPKKTDRFFFTVNANAQINEDAFSIASDGNFNGGYSFEVGVNMRLHYSAFYVKETDCRQKKKGEITRDQMDKLRKAYLLQQAGTLQRLYVQGNMKAQLEVKRDSLLKVLDNNTRAAEPMTEDRVAEIAKAIALCEKDLGTMQVQDCDNACDNMIDSLVAFESNLAKPNPFSIHWLRFGALYGKEEYTLLDTLQQSLAGQLSTVPFDKKGLSLTYNYLFKGRYVTLYFNGGIGYGYNNSLLGTTPKNFTDSKTYPDSMGNSTRTYKEDKKGYLVNGSPYMEFNSLVPRAALQIFVGEGRNFGLELSSQVSFDFYKDETKNVWDAQFGLMYSGTRTDTPASRYTIQLLFKAKDITTAMNPGNDTFGKKLNVSVRLAVPFSNIFF